MTLGDRNAHSHDEPARAWAQILLVVIGFCCLVHAADAVATTLGLSWRHQQSVGILGRPLLGDESIDILAVLRWFGVVATGLGFLAWWRAAMAAAKSYGRKGRNLPSQTALVGVWFLPVCNTFLPYVYMRDLAWAVDPGDLEEPPLRERDAAGYRSHALEEPETASLTPPHLLVSAWWTAFLFAVLFALLEQRALSGMATSSFGGAMGFHVACDVMALVTAIVTAALVSTITQSAEERKRRVLASPARRPALR